MIVPVNKNNKPKRVATKKSRFPTKDVQILNVPLMNIDLNITLSCNLSCPGCNRMCDIYKNRTEHMSLEQINKFIQQCKNTRNYRMGEVRLIGGEPLMHPLFVDIYKSFIEKNNQKYVNKIIVTSNGTIKTTLPSSKLRIKNVKDKYHIPYFIHPKDLGYKIDLQNPQKNCHAQPTCGFSLDKYGYLPCPMAIMIVRLFGLLHLYRYSLPKDYEPWGLEEICQHCNWALPEKWKKEHIYHINNFPEEYKIPSPQFQKAIENFDQDKFHRTQKEF